MGDAVRVAVVGCGFQGRLHLECLRRIPDASVVAVCDRDPDRLGAAARDFGIPHAFQHHQDLLGEHAVDLLTICTMPDTHREIAVDALDAGAAVLCEKPMAADLAAAVAMADAAERAGRPLAIGFNLRFTTAAQAARSFVRDGRLGTPVCARGSMLETRVPWWGPHHVRAISGGGAINSTAVHMIDLLMWLAGNPRPLTATASTTRLFPRKRGETARDASEAKRYDVEDLAFGHVRFEDGFWMTFDGGWTWDAPGSECRFDLVGDRAQVSADPLRFWAERGGDLVDLTGDTTGELDSPESLERELADVVNAVRYGRSPTVTAVQALEVQAVVDALYRSAAEGREVDVVRTRSRPLAPAAGGRDER